MGGGRPTVITWLVCVTQPSRVDTSTTVYTPGSSKVNDGEVLVLDPSPPKFQALEEPCTLVLVNWTDKGAAPVVGEAVKAAVSGEAST